jgi:PBSX family phage terminase large subunit|nr:MAG TPA: large terminase [Caudoviricetes sp.]
MISDKQKKILAFPYSKYDAIICDGAVRSGKTSIMMWAFVDWAMREFSGQRFGICGKTVDSASKNIVVPFVSMTLAKERYTLRWRRADKILEVRRGAVTNYFEVFGGKDESSFALIQGRTLAGVLLDEVALMPESFFNQALARCSVDGARLWFSCNPDNPHHWFYINWIKKHKERNALYLHFEMTDNPSLSEKTLERYRTQYTGVFYDRYIRGLWVAADGLIYPMFGESNIVDDIPDSGEYYISVDYGTLNPFSAGLWCWDGKHATRIREYYYSGRDERLNKTDEEYYSELENLAGDLQIRSVVVDPSAASFIEVIHRHHRFSVRKAINDVVPGIVTTARYLQDGTIKIHRDCKDEIREFGLYRWDEKSNEDRPIKENDHAMDETRYFVMTILRYKAGKEKYIPLSERVVNWY